MHVSNYGRVGYTAKKAFDPDHGPSGTEFMVTTYDDGTETVCTRPGEFATDRRWSPEVLLRPDCCTTHDGAHVHGCIRGRVDGRTHEGACLRTAGVSA